jgi:hypothetical protein
MYVNGKMRPVEIIPGMGGGGLKENDGGLRTFVNATQCTPSTTMEKKRRKKKRSFLE